MKKLIITSATALLISLSSFAQEATTSTPQAERKAPTVEEIAKRKADHMRQQYLLGEDQYDKVYKLCLKQAKQDEARRKEIEAERETLEKDMKGILNDAQWERYEQSKKHMHRAPFNNRRNFKKSMQPNFMQMRPQMGGCPMGMQMPQMPNPQFKGMPQMKGMPNQPAPQMKGGKPFAMPQFDGKPMGEPEKKENATTEAKAQEQK